MWQHVLSLPLLSAPSPSQWMQAQQACIADMVTVCLVLQLVRVMKKQQSSDQAADTSCKTVTRSSLSLPCCQLRRQQINLFVLAFGRFLGQYLNEWTVMQILYTCLLNATSCLLSFAQVVTSFALTTQTHPKSLSSMG